MLEPRYSASEMCAVLSASLKPIGERKATYISPLTHPYFYTGETESINTIIFPPVSDMNNIGLDSIDEMLCITRDYCRKNAIQIDQKKMVFPVAEAQKILFWPRMHWVTLHYDPSTKAATVVDSTPWSKSLLYSTSPMRQSLTAGLSRFGLEVKTFVIEHQNVQNDNDHCGAWTAANIRAFARGASVSEQIKAWKPEDITRIVQENITLVTEAKKIKAAKATKLDELIELIDQDEECCFCRLAF